MGYLLYKATKRKLPSYAQTRLGRLPLLLLVSVAVSLLPDLDAIPGLLLGNMKAFHNNATHSLVVGAALALLAAGLVWWKYREGFLYWAGLIFAGYAAHVLMDSATMESRGVMLFWPFTLERYAPGFTLFMGVRWSDGLLSAEHVLTLATESLFVIFVFVISRWLLSEKEPQGPKHSFNISAQTDKE